MLDKQLEELTQRIAIEFYRAKSMMMGSVPIVNKPLIKKISIQSIDGRTGASGVSMNQLAIITPSGVYDFGTRSVNTDTYASYVNGQIFATSSDGNNKVSNILGNSGVYWRSTSINQTINIILTTPSVVNEIELCDYISSSRGSGYYYVTFHDINNTIVDTVTVTNLSTVANNKGSIKPNY